MALNLAALTKTAMGAATKAGVTATATITRPAPPPNPLTGVQSGSPVTQTVDVMQADAFRQARRSDSTWAQARTVLFVAAGSLTFTPQLGDAVSWGGTTQRLTVLEDYRPAGTVIGYFLGLGTKDGRNGG